MIPNGRAFDGKESIVYEGKKYSRWYYVDRTGDYQLRFKIIFTKSSYKQGIALFFWDFVGTVSLNQKELKNLKGFQHYAFWQDEISNGEFALDVHLESGKLTLGNLSLDEQGVSHCGEPCCAFWIENLAKNHLRFHCNDHEADDDFDDMILDLEYVKV